MRVLVVDDDPVSLRLLRSYLEKWGYQVTEAADGVAAWSLFQREEFSLVIADWMMPEMDGLELVRHIRSLDRPGYVYCMLLTARSQKEDLVDGMDAGADDFLSKPFDRDELRVRLREGERIVNLERAAAAQSSSAAGSGPAGQGPAAGRDLAHQIQEPLTAAITALDDLRSRAAEVTRFELDPIRQHLERARRAAAQLDE